MMLRFILLAASLSIARAMSDTEAELRQRVEFLEDAVQQLLERESERAVAIPADHRRLKASDIKLDNRKGVEIQTDAAWVTMGAKKDFKIVYTGESSGAVLGNLEVTGELKSQSMKALTAKADACVTVVQMNTAIRKTQTCSIRKLSANHPKDSKSITCKNGLKTVHDCFNYCREAELCKGFWYYDNGRCCPKVTFSDTFTQKIPGGGFYDYDCGPTTAIPFGIAAANIGGSKGPKPPKGSYIEEFHGKLWFLYLQNGKGKNDKNTLRFGKNSGGYGAASLEKLTDAYKMSEAEFDQRKITTVMAVTEDREYVIISYADGSAIKASDAFAPRGPSKQVILKDWTGRSDSPTKKFGPATSDKHGPFFHDNWGKGYGWMWTDHSGVNDMRMGSVGLSQASQSVNHGWRWFAMIPNLKAPTPAEPRAPKGSYVLKMNGKVWWLYLQNGKGKNYKNTLTYGANKGGYGSATPDKRTGAYKVAENIFSNKKVKTVMALTDDGEYVVISYSNGSPILASDAFAMRGPSKQVILKDWKGRGKTAPKKFGPATSDNHGPFFHDNWGKGYGWMWTGHGGGGDMRMGSIGLTKASQSVNHGWRWFAQFENY